MKYECSECKKQFIHPAKLIITTPTESTENYVCPYCRNLNFNEAPIEQKTGPEILEMFDAQNVDEVNVKLKLNEGWKVYENYAKVIRLAKYPLLKA